MPRHPTEGGLKPASRAGVGAAVLRFRAHRTRGRSIAVARLTGVGGFEWSSPEASGHGCDVGGAGGIDSEADSDADGDFDSDAEEADGEGAWIPPLDAVVLPAFEIDRVGRVLSVSSESLVGVGVGVDHESNAPSARAPQAPAIVPERSWHECHGIRRRTSGRAPRRVRSVRGQTRASPVQLPTSAVRIPWGVPSIRKRRTDLPATTPPPLVRSWPGDGEPRPRGTSGSR